MNHEGAETEGPKRSIRGMAGAGRRAMTGDQSLVRETSLTPGRALPLLVEPAVAGVDLPAWAAAHRAWIEERLWRDGGLLFRGFAMTDPEQLQAMVEAVGGKPLEYRERSSPRTQVLGRIYTSTDYPPDQSIFFHNENSYQNAWPAKILFFCHVAPEHGGATPLADVRRVHDRVPAEIRQRFAERGIMYVRNFHPGLGLSWQTVFQTADRGVAEEYCRQGGLTCEWRDGDVLRVRSVRPAVVRHPRTGEALWFNHGVFFHVSTLAPEVSRGLLAQLAEEDLPSQSYYGDGSPIEPEVLAAVRAAYQEEEVSFPWRQGDVLLLDNMLVAHARAPFSGPRRILVGMAERIGRDELRP